MADEKIAWEEDATARLKNVPFFVRPMVRARVERVARERGLTRVTVALMAELKDAQHRGR